MALRQLVITKKIQDLRKKLDDLKAKDADFEQRKAELQQREAGLEEAVNEITEETSEEDKAAVDEAVEAFEKDQEALDAEHKQHEDEKQKLEDEIRKLETELEELNERAKTPPVFVPAKSEQRGVERNMKTRVKFFDSIEQRDAFFAREEVRQFISAIRDIKTRGVTNGSLTVPDVMLEILRNNLEQYSKLAKYVTVKSVNGTARQNIMGAAPEGVWMEAEGEFNELDMALNQIEVDGYMVGGIIWVHNNLLKDSDIALGTEIMDQLGKAIGKGVDRAIIYGTGIKMPLGIVTRLAQTSAPNDWGTNAPAWTDLHTSNIKKLNINTATGATFYASLIEALGAAKPDYSDGRAFWVMNRKTHINIMTKALAFDAAAALLAGVNNQMPIIGGDIVELEIVGDNEIIGGFGSVYLLAEREGAAIESSEHARFVKHQTGFKGYARYDGMPVFGEAFVMVSFDNTDAVTSTTFPKDYANTELGELTVTSEAGTDEGDTKIKVSGQEQSGTTLLYKTSAMPAKVYSGMKKTSAWQSFGTNPNFTTGVNLADLTPGHVITVVEFDADGKAIKAGIATIVVNTGA
ncbi:MAG TPA: phage major capsid protein [Peptococcaceae bacterium]|nr:phage major capsid protein [Peptococcaceae bacterium]